MKRLESNFLNMATVLTLVCVVAAALLSFFYGLTLEPIEKSNAQKQQEAINEVLSMPSDSIHKEQKGDTTLYYAMKDGVNVGVATEATTKSGFNGEVSVMVGFDMNGTVLNYTVLHQAETPGLGSKMQDWFRPQGEVEKSLLETIFGFQVVAKERKSSVLGKNLKDGYLVVSKDGGEIDAITAATISSRAFLSVVNEAYNKAFGEWDGTTGASAMESEEWTSVSDSLAVEEGDCIELNDSIGGVQND